MNRAPEPHVWEINHISYLEWIATEETTSVGPLGTHSPIKISVIMPVMDPEPEILSETLSAIYAQHHTNWELCIVDDGSKDPDVIRELQDAAKSKVNVSLHRFEENQGISAASNAALKMATGTFVALVDHDDRIPKHALSTVAHFINNYPAAKFLYSDSDHLDQNGNRCKPFFKPDWDYLRLLSQNYLNHLTIIKTSLIRSLGGWRDGFQGSQDYDLYLRISEALHTEQILHIPHILYHWRQVKGSAGRGNLAVAVHSARKAISEHLARKGLNGTVGPAGKALIYNRVTWVRPVKRPKVLIVTYESLERKSKSALLRESTTSFDYTEMSIDLKEGLDVFIGNINRSITTGAFNFLLVRSDAIVIEDLENLSDLIAISSTNQFGVISARCIDTEGRLSVGPIFENLPDSKSNETPKQSTATSISRGYVANLLIDQSVDRVSPKFFGIGIQALMKINGRKSDCESLDSWVRDLCVECRAEGLRNIWLWRDKFLDVGTKNTHQHSLDLGTATKAEERYLYNNENFTKLNWTIHKKYLS